MTVEELHNWRKRLIFRSWHRGTREMDLIMGSFADKHVPDFSEEDLAVYEDLLLDNDPDIYNWYIGAEEPPQARKSPILDLFLAHKLVS